jgi:hypothetical protein
LEKLALVGSIVVDPTVQAQELTQSVGEEITRMIAEQKKLEIRFEELISTQHALRSLPNKSKLRENQAGPAPVSAAISMHVAETRPVVCAGGAATGGRGAAAVHKDPVPEPEGQPERS